MHLGRRAYERAGIIKGRGALSLGRSISRRCRFVSIARARYSRRHLNKSTTVDGEQLQIDELIVRSRLLPRLDPFVRDDRKREDARLMTAANKLRRAN